MSVLSILLSSFVGASLALSDFRVTFQLSGGSSAKGGDGKIVKTPCVGSGANTYSDWAMGPSTGMKGLQIGLEKCGGASIKDQDLRLCVQVASSKKEGTKTCTDWASDGAGGWSDFSQTIENEHIYKARVMVETKSAPRTSFKDIEAGIRATDVNSNKDANNAALWGKPAWTGFLTASGESQLQSKSVYANDRNGAIKAVKIYFQVDTGVQYCCTLSVGKPRYYQTCAGDVRSQSKTQCELKDAKINGPENKCQWVDCQAVGYCAWDGVLGNEQKGKRTCAKHFKAADCKVGCEWKLGAMPEWYALDLDYNGEAKIVEVKEEKVVSSANPLNGDDDDSVLAVDRANVLAESEDMQWILIGFVALGLAVCGYGVYNLVFGKEEKEAKDVLNEYTPISQTV